MSDPTPEQRVEIAKELKTYSEVFEIIQTVMIQMVQAVYEDADPEELPRLCHTATEQVIAAVKNN